MGWGDCYEFLFRVEGWHSYSDLVREAGLSKNQATVGLARCRRLDDIAVRVEPRVGGRQVLLCQHKRWM